MAIFHGEDDAVPEAVTPETSKPTVTKKAVEAWAAEKRMLPEFFLPSPAQLPERAQAAPGGVMALSMSGLKAPAHNPEFWKFAAAKAMHGWVIGAELTEAEFDDAITAATTAMGG
jgi:hypothetical protein